MVFIAPAIILACIIFFCAFNYDGTGTFSTIRRRKVANIFCFALVCLSAGSFIILEYPKSNDVVVQLDSQDNSYISTVKGPFDVALCIPGVTYCINMSTVHNVDAKVRPISENPKVRLLRYTFQVEIEDMRLFINKGPQIYFKDDKRWKDGQNSLVDMTEYKMPKLIGEYLAYEFNEAHSKKLSTIYNPHERTDQAKLEYMLRQYMDTHLKKVGLKLFELISLKID